MAGRATTWRRWTADEDKRLAELIPLHGVRETARLLRRTPAAIGGRCTALGIARPGLFAGERADGRHYYSPRDRYRLLGLVERGGVPLAADRLGRSRHAIYALLSRMGISARGGKIGAYDAAERLGVGYTSYAAAFDALGYQFPRRACTPKQLARIADWLLVDAPPLMQKQLGTTNRRLQAVRDEMLSMDEA
jgi:hypothetical protein